MNNDVEEYVKAEESKKELLSPHKCIYKIKLKCWNITNISILQIQNQYFFLPIESWFPPHCPAYLPIYLQRELKKNDDLHKELEDKLGHPRHFLDLHAPENDSKPSPDWLNTNKHSKTASEGDVMPHSRNPAPTPLSALHFLQQHVLTTQHGERSAAMRWTANAIQMNISLFFVIPIRSDRLTLVQNKTSVKNLSSKDAAEHCSCSNGGNEKYKSKIVKISRLTSGLRPNCSGSRQQEDCCGDGGWEVSWRVMQGTDPQQASANQLAAPEACLHHYINST